MKKDLDFYRRASEKGTIPDDENPIFLFNTALTSLLLLVSERKVDAVGLAKLELASRGVDKQGKWVGFERAEAIHNPVQKFRNSVKRRLR